MKGKGTIILKLFEESQTITIHISDTGSGIKKENFKKIFSPGLLPKGVGPVYFTKRIITDYHRGKQA